MSDSRVPVHPEQLAIFYLRAKMYVIDAGFADEIDWQQNVSIDFLDEPTFLRESAWVVLSSGFRESVLQARFGRISRAFFDWVSAETIVAQREMCRINALKAFNNHRKIDAIVGIAERVTQFGIKTIRDQLVRQNMRFLMQFPYIGPTTACHLAKNLGIQMVKPDRHLKRMARKNGYESPNDMCRVISKLVGDPLSVIDIVFWRYASIVPRGDALNM